MFRRLLIGFVVAGALCVVASPASAATCTAAQKKKHVAALKKFQRQTVVKRRAYFRRHKSPRARAAFLRRQRARLKALRRAAACSPRVVVDIAIAFIEPPAVSASRRRVTYRLRVTNQSRTAAPQVSVLTSRSPGATVVSTSGGRCSGRSAVVCDLGRFARGQSKTLDVVLRPFGLGAIELEADAFVYRAVDRNPRNDRVAAAIDVAPPAPSCPASLWAGLNSGLLVEGDLAEDHIGYSARGAARALMVFVDFPDAWGSESTTELYDLYVPEAARMFSELSYGRFGIDVAAVHRWVRLPQAATYYSSITLLQHAVAAVDAEIDFRQFGLVYVVTAASAPIRTGAYVLPPGAGADADGVRLRHGAMLAFNSRSDRTAHLPARILFHETSHALGLPDLYDFATGGHPFAGAWDPMGSLWPTTHFLAWHKWKLGWLDAAQISCLSGPGTIEETVSPIAVPGGVKAVVTLTGPSTAIVAEARRPIGEDSDLCEEGVLVYAVDGTVTTGAGPIRVRPAQPDGDRVAACSALYEAPFDVAPGEVSRFEDAAVTVEVLASTPDGYRVRVTTR